MNPVPNPYTSFLADLSQRILLLDGDILWALWQSVHRKNNVRELCAEQLILTETDLLCDAYASYLDAGADIIRTPTQASSRLNLQAFELEHLHERINSTGAKLAREAADRIKTRTVYVAGVLGPTPLSPLPRLDETVSALDRNKSLLHSNYVDQLEILIREGIDLVMVEDIHDAIHFDAIMTVVDDIFTKHAICLPVICSFVIWDNDGYTLAREKITDIVSLSKWRSHIDLIGLQRGRDVNKIALLAQALATSCSLPIRLSPDLDDNFPQVNHLIPIDSPDKQARDTDVLLKSADIRVVGGCNRMSASHVRALAELLKKHAGSE